MAQAQNEAQRILVSLKVTTRELGDAGGVSRQAAHTYLRGVRKPLPPTRERIAERWPEVEPVLWDVLPGGPRPAPESAVAEEPDGAAAPLPSPAAPKAETGALAAALLSSPRRSPRAAELDARAMAREHLAEVHRLLEAARDEQRLADVLKLMDLERKAILDLAKFSGELTATEESKLTETKRWREVRQTIVDVVAQFPEAAKALAAALEGVKA